MADLTQWPEAIIPDAAAILRDMELVWQEIAKATVVPDYLLVPAEIAIERRVYRWRGRKYVCGAQYVPARKFMAALEAEVARHG